MKKFIPSLLCIVLVTACGPSNRERKLADEVQEADQRIAKQLLELQAERDTFAKNLAAAIKNANAWKDAFDESAKTNKALKAEIERLKGKSSGRAGRSLSGAQGLARPPRTKK